MFDDPNDDDDDDNDDEQKSTALSAFDVNVATDRPLTGEKRELARTTRTVPATSAQI